MRKRNHGKVISTNIYRKMKSTKTETFCQLIENLLLSGTVFTVTDPDSFYISNDNIIIESFNDITLLQQDINEKENEIRYLNHGLEILSEVSKLKLNDINNQITSIHTALILLSSPHLIKLKTIALRSLPIWILMKFSFRGRSFKKKQLYFIRKYFF